MTPLWLAVALAVPPPAGDPSASFPGQWAPPPDVKYATHSGKACWTRIADPTERSLCLEALVRDFGRLDRYAAANAALGTAKDPQRVVFLGDSITDNWSKRGYGGFFPGKRYVNRGIGGTTTAQALLRFRADVVALSPRAVVILAGTNDLAGNTGAVRPEAIIDNLATMVELARAHKIGVALASLLPVVDGKAGPDGKPILVTADRPPAAIVKLNQEIEALARKHRLPYIDYHRAMIDEKGALKAELTDDGLHPNAAGYAVMAPLAEQAIRKLVR